MNTAFVKLWGVTAGAVAWDETTGISAFESIRCKHAADIIDEIEATVLNWKKFAKEVGVSSKLSETIYTTIKDWN
jgi:hypothetical protein